MCPPRLLPLQPEVNPIITHWILAMPLARSKRTYGSAAPCLGVDGARGDKVEEAMAGSGSIDSGGEALGGGE